eukprot:CAMPEP_0176489912 /NCGR_PEP_ID=MMETSP0200_2-20121128/7571_1 /TAXON_ID=947934 /ORGANISM="Chaetoceros sp., Strain GSL56" /LENGTH=342 /DNA_ID=CAMNT_0017887145 /DNA_START=529 /DNA_END=1558 /DNA_ORIENTATION=-
MDEQHNPSRLQEFQTAFILQLLANGSQQSRQEEDTARVVPPRNGSSISGAPATCITNLEATDSDPTTTRSRNGTMTRAQVAPPHVPPARSRAVSPPPAVAAGAANSSHPLAKLEHVTSSTADDSNNNCVTSLTFLPIRPLHAPPKLQRFPLSTATNDNALLSNKICSENTTSTPCSRSVLGPIFPCRARAAADTDGIKNRGQFSSIAIIPRGRAISINEMTCMDHSDNNKSYPRIDNVQQSDHGDSTNNCIKQDFQDKTYVKWKDALEKRCVDQFIVPYILGREGVIFKNVKNLPRVEQDSVLLTVGGGVAKSTVVAKQQGIDGFVLLMEEAKGVRLDHAIG